MEALRSHGAKASCPVNRPQRLYDAVQQSCKQHSRVVSCRAAQPSWLEAAQQVFSKLLSLTNTGNGQQTTVENPVTAIAATAVLTEVEPVADTLNGDGGSVDEKSSEYTEEMQAKMGTSLTYRHEDGINYNFVLPDLIVGSCLQGPEDVDRLVKEAGVTTVFSLQEDCDMEYFSIDITAIQDRCKEVGVQHVRFPVRDFDPFDLRLKLPKAVARLARAHQAEQGVAYIHCTAGLGRAPATALAYMYWLRGWDLQHAYDTLKAARTCSPRIEAIRAATGDLLTDSSPVELTIGLRRRGTASRFQVAGLDVGWHTLLDLQENPKTKRMEVTRQLLPGSYPFKFIIDGTWCASFDYPTYQDGINVNNMLTVLPRESKDGLVRQRLLSPTGCLTAEERKQVEQVLGDMPDTLEDNIDEKSSEYTEEMQAKMGTSLTYRHEDGINYNFVLPDLIVGSCLQGPEDVDRLVKEAGVTTVFSLQEDCDMEYFSIDITTIQNRCKEVGVQHVRFPVRDFDPFDLRLKLPKAVARLAKVHNPKYGVIYIHCTAGLGRAPAAALAYMYWLRGWQLQEAVETLTAQRPCSPRIEAIRAATADLLTDSPPVDVTISLRQRGTLAKAQVAGLDVGWHTRLDLQENPKTHRMEVARQLLPGSYPFKFVLDDVWCANLDYPTYQDGNNLNNIITVLPRTSEDASVRERLLSPTGQLQDDERLLLSSKLCPWSTHDRKLHLPTTTV